MADRSPSTLGLAALERFLVVAMVELIAAEETLNSLNVYPVPDGDTGSNLRATWSAFFPGSTTDGTATKADAQKVDTGDLERLGDDRTDQQLVRDGLRRLTAGACGNAGVIMSEYIRGCCDELKYDDAGRLQPIDGDRIARMLHAGAAFARSAVEHPVEGTLLSVADAAAAGAAWARSRAGGSENSMPTPAVVLETAVKEATEALKRSPQQLPALNGAGVVDSGGAGLLFILEALARVAGGRHGLPRAKDRSWLDVAPRHGFADDQVCQVSTHGPAFEFMAVAEGLSDEAAADLRAELSAYGDSVVVAGGEGVHRVHVHTDDVLGAASLVRSRAWVSAPSITRFAGPVATLHEVTVDVEDELLQAHARALGFQVWETQTTSAPQAGYLITDGRRGESPMAELLGRPTAVHAVATMEACAFLAACDEEPDFHEAAEEAVMLEVVEAQSWASAEQEVGVRAGAVEQLVIFIDPDAPRDEAAAFVARTKETCEEAVVLRVASGALVQLGVE